MRHAVLPERVRSAEIPRPASEYAADRATREETDARSVARLCAVLLLVVGAVALGVVVARHGELVTLRHGLWFVIGASALWALTGRSRASRTARWRTLREVFVAVAVVIALGVLAGVLGLGRVLESSGPTLAP